MKTLKQTIIGIVFLVVLPCSVAEAQNNESSYLEVVGEAAVAEGELIADRDDNRDVNGNLTAGLKVKTDLTGLTFRSDYGIHKIQQLPDETLLFLSANEKVISVFKDGYIPLRIVLKEEGIELESGEVWELELTGKDKGANFPVRFKVDPKDALLTINGKEHQLDGIFLDIELGAGDHNVRVYKERYAVMKDSISISSEQVNVFEYTLTQVDPMRILINSRPEGANLYINDSPGAVGKTPYRINVYPGPVKFELQLEGYEKMTDEFFLIQETEDVFYNLVKE